MVEEKSTFWLKRGEVRHICQKSHENGCTHCTGRHCHVHSRFSFWCVFYQTTDVLDQWSRLRPLLLDLKSAIDYGVHFLFHSQQTTYFPLSFSLVFQLCNSALLSLYRHSKWCDCNFESYNECVKKRNDLYSFDPSSIKTRYLALFRVMYIF